MSFLFIVKHAAAFLVLLLAAAGAGSFIVRRGTLALRAAAGLAALAHVLFFLALLGWVRVWVVVALIVVSVVGLLRAQTGEKRLLFFLPLLAPMFLLALRPPRAFDETLYHLPFVRAIAESGRLQYLTDFRFPVFPQLHELLCVPMFLLVGDTATHLVALAEIAIAAALLFEWGGPLAAALFLGSPIVVQLGTITYVDAALALFVAAAFYCLDREHFALAGFFLGTACSVKYLGGYFAVAALIIVIVLRRRKAIVVALTTLAAALPTTLWITLKSGDPLFPFMRDTIYALPMPRVATSERIVRVLRVAWDVTSARARVNYQPPFTPFFIFMIVIVIVVAMRDVRARCVALLAGAYFVVFAFLPQDSRYLVPLLPLLSVVAALSIGARRAKVLACIAIAPGVLYILYLLFVRETPRVPEYAAITRAGDATIYVCGGEQLKYYARGRMLGDFAGPYAWDRVLARRDTNSIAMQLRAIGADYFLVAKRTCARPLRNGGMDLAYEDGAAQLWRVQRSQPAP